MGQLASIPGSLQPGHPIYPFHPSKPGGENQQQQGDLSCGVYESRNYLCTVQCSHFFADNPISSETRHGASSNSHIQHW